MSSRTRRLEMLIPAGDSELPSLLTIPNGSVGVVIVAHDSRSRKLERHNRVVTAKLSSRQIATLRVDLLVTQQIDHDLGDHAFDGSRFELAALAQRLVAVTDFARGISALSGLKIGYFGANAGGTAALIAAAQRAAEVTAIVVCGGHPDFAGEHLANVEAPTLLLVGSEDPRLLGAGWLAAKQMHAPCQLSVVHGASEAFDEPFALTEVARRATDFFLEQFAADRVQMAPVSHA